MPTESDALKCLWSALDTVSTAFAGYGLMRLALKAYNAL